jgi:uncharacterized short protein YbdD (DUF466 family)
MPRFRDWLRHLWAGLRELSGDAAYERYCRDNPRPPLSREEFYLDRLRRKYSGVSRCC